MPCLLSRDRLFDECARPIRREARLRAHDAADRSAEPGHVRLSQRRGKGSHRVGRCRLVRIHGDDRLAEQKRLLRQRRATNNQRRNRGSSGEAWKTGQSPNGGAFRGLPLALGREGGGRVGRIPDTSRTEKRTRKRTNRGTERPRARQTLRAVALKPTPTTATLHVAYLYGSTVYKIYSVINIDCYTTQRVFIRTIRVWRLASWPRACSRAGCTW